jgi:hypothetical protein
VRTLSIGTPVTVFNPITLATGSWHCIAVDVTFGPTGRVDVYVDDAPLTTPFTGDLGASAFPAGIRFVDVGILSGPTVASVLYDDVSIARRHIACN